MDDKSSRGLGVCARGAATGGSVTYLTKVTESGQTERTELEDRAGSPRLTQLITLFSQSYCLIPLEPSRSAPAHELTHATT